VKTKLLHSAVKQILILVGIALMLLISRPAVPQEKAKVQETELYGFTGGNDGQSPQAGLIFDKAGNLYGTTPNGGSKGYGIVFVLHRRPSEYWVEHEFSLNRADGFYPVAGVIFDSAGNLYGTAPRESLKKYRFEPNEQ